ncbi:MAG: hypothetical protein IT428_00430 [Planctomycetaceae bacterium]|nr:hypothetical protein [Planctomycetaceae bacterium]
MVPEVDADVVPRFSLFDGKPPEARPGDSPLRRLQIDRYNASLEELRMIATSRAVGAGSLGDSGNDYVAAVEKVAASGLALVGDQAERIQVLERIVTLHKRLEEDEKRRVELGVGSLVAQVRARHARIGAEIDLEVARNSTPWKDAFPWQLATGIVLGVAGTVVGFVIGRRRKPRPA